MATRRNTRNSGARRGKKKLPVWLVLLIGLGLGALLMWGGQRLFFHGGKPLSGISGLFSGKRASQEHASGATASAAKEPAKPHFDFYTILPEIESVLPERFDKGEKPGKKPATAKPERPEVASVRDTGVVYVLQAASYANIEDADRLKARLVLNGLEAHIEKVSIEGKGTFFRVRLGPYAKVDDLDTAYQKLGQQGIKAMRLKVKKAPGA